MSNDDERRTRRRGILLALVVLLAILGVADGVYLTMVHVDYEMGKSSDLAEVCGQLASRGCMVTTGRFGSIMGVPVSVVGLAGAAATAVVGIGAWIRRSREHDAWRGTVLGLAGLSLLATLAMFVLSTIEGSYCPFCVIWYGINIALGLTAWFARGPRQDVSPGTLVDDAIGWAGAAALGAFIAGFAAGHAVYSERKATLQAELDMILDSMVAQIRQEPETKIDLRGLPSRGPEDATLTIVEIADLQCPHCKRLWESTHEYSEHSTASVRTVFIHYPLDDQCNGGVQRTHEFACQAAEAVECARLQGEEKFWEYGDVLFANQPSFERDDLIRYAGELSLDTDAFTRCIDEHETMLEIRRSIVRARLLKVRYVPTYFVNGRKFEGAPKPWLPLLLDKWGRAIQAEGNTPEPASTPDP